MAYSNIPRSQPLALSNLSARGGYRRTDSTWSALGGNGHAQQRDDSPFRDSVPYFKKFSPFGPDGVTLEHSAGELHFYVSPGQIVSKASKRLFAEFSAGLGNPSEFPARVEIEFSRGRPYGVDSTPRAFRSSAITWALSMCNQVLICIDHVPGDSEGEAHSVVATCQVVFRCAERDAGAWQAYLEPRLHRRHSLTVVHAAAGRA